ncbi:uncharacterized protein STEHIDRAFT_58619 [Stereum hirsutum FP-91666 SS1]|uniref:uncharacterized protein n=1 Tax=Stereum hirsutum (strain FP-91666) TaxID=721885 RepID=UPI000444A26F|nr:uncharacterized protein STEHIDRAFT_58619 [Stereum hirsutum FP-91666 SS1]EIM85742.1 hypothetical protein STEHIDRAFT_58619 [Stereum hirsutum FP-91666 SS1]
MLSSLFSTARLFASRSSTVASLLIPSRFFSSTPTPFFPKLKTHSGTKKRWRSIGNGGGPFKRAHAYHQHLNVGKRPGRKNRLAQGTYSHGPQTSKLKKLMPYA